MLNILKDIAETVFKIDPTKETYCSIQRAQQTQNVESMLVWRLSNVVCQTLYPRWFNV